MYSLIGFARMMMRTRVVVIVLRKAWRHDAELAGFFSREWMRALSFGPPQTDGRGRKDEGAVSQAARRRANAHSAFQ